MKHSSGTTRRTGRGNSKRTLPTDDQLVNMDFTNGRAEFVTLPVNDRPKNETPAQAKYEPQIQTDDDLPYSAINAHLDVAQKSGRPESQLFKRKPSTSRKLTE